MHGHLPMAPAVVCEPCARGADTHLYGDLFFQRGEGGGGGGVGADEPLFAKHKIINKILRF